MIPRLPGLMVLGLVVLAAIAPVMADPPRVSVYIASSVDGFIAREDGSVDWLMTPDLQIEGEDYGYAEFIAGIDAIVMGRRTFEKALSFGDWPYGGMRVVVLSRSLESLPDNLPDSVSIMAGSPAEVLARLGEWGIRSVYLDGGRTIQGFLRSGAVDELIISRIPVLLGTGVPLFGALETDVKLRHISTKAFDSGIVQSHYQVSPAGDPGASR